MIGNYSCGGGERIKIRAVRFSPKGRMLVLGLTGGLIMTFFMEFTFNNLKQLSSVELRYFQEFTMNQAY